MVKLLFNHTLDLLVSVFGFHLFFHFLLFDHFCNFILLFTYFLKLLDVCRF